MVKYEDLRDAFLRRTFDNPGPHRLSIYSLGWLHRSLDTMTDFPLEQMITSFQRMVHEICPHRVAVPEGNVVKIIEEIDANTDYIFAVVLRLTDGRRFLHISNPAIAVMLKLIQ
jgi:hypothetical protein